MARKATGKYAKVIDKLPRFLGQEPDQQEKVNAVKEEILKQSGGTFIPAAALVEMYVKARDEKDRIKDLSAAAELETTAIEQLLLEQYEVEGTSSITLETGDNVRTQWEPYAKVKDKEAFRQWCVAEGLERSMHLMWATTNSLVKERLLAEKDVPPGVEATAHPKVVLTRG